MIKETSSRKIHHYKRIRVTELALSGSRHTLPWQGEAPSYEAFSYGGARVGMLHEEPQPFGKRRAEASLKSAKHKTELAVVSLFWNEAQVEKYLTDRKAFFEQGSNSLASRLCSAYIKLFPG
ncbi:hypothetical protein PUV47_12690 [Pseudovibrio exalbescens]|uniref:hypothetical protein n=1 Tax=Pseudovibrio exalbescens TaxID=197461 RepID=UPI00236529DF|nr:hypothetical protein [Pseudovibrio exalbescens]MDD7910776.1 hypothetical protein [Pseudovibrio exalbescens]